MNTYGNEHLRVQCFPGLSFSCWDSEQSIQEPERFAGNIPTNREHKMTKQLRGFSTRFERDQSRSNIATEKTKGGKRQGEEFFFFFQKKALTRSVNKKMWNCVFLALICQERGEETSHGLQSRTLFKVIILNSRLYLNNNLRNGEPAGSLLRCVPRARAGPGEVLQLGTHSSSPSWGQEPRNFSLRHVFSAYASVGSWNWVHG